MAKRTITLSFVLALTLILGCKREDPMAMFVKKMDSAPASERPPNWEEVKQLMARPAPIVGAVAPDFSLPSVDGNQSLTMSRHRGEHPLVLIFGSFT
ncbi:MAG TPA: hypothetical protein VJZ71_07915 [Phycisphaerae bacterium]|nr:hypothetical protein [Phycisphaerae bacterium]